jgi:hypothetical protein
LAYGISVHRNGIYGQNITSISHIQVKINALLKLLIYLHDFFYHSDIERLCRLVIYSIDASDVENVTIEKIGRLPLEKSKI